MRDRNIEISREKLEAFCQKWGVAELALFGSALRDDFNDDSDVDLLATFTPGYGITFNNRPDMLDELQQIFGRPVDLVEKRLLRNPFRRHAILTTKRVIYAA
jgi:uncharacterized protein